MSWSNTTQPPEHPKPHVTSHWRLLDFNMSSEKGAHDITRAVSDDNAHLKSELDDDAVKLAEMGYTQDLKRNYSTLSVLGVGFSLTNSWFGISAALITGKQAVEIRICIVRLSIIPGFIGQRKGKCQEASSLPGEWTHRIDLD